MSKSVIYQTKNLYNEKNGILPYLYIGSQQNYSENYLGSSKNLILDIKKYGVESFEKTILCEFNFEIDNKLLRKIESDIQKFLDVAKDQRYYNKTNSALVGYTETPEERRSRMEKTWVKRKLWWDSLSDEERRVHNKKLYQLSSKHPRKLSGKTYNEIYGEEKSLEIKKRLSGKNNGLSKQVVELSTGKIFETITEAKQYFRIKKHATLVKMCKKGDIVKFLNN